MWAWDARQQFGIAGLALAAVGAIRVWSLSKPWAVFVWLAYAITTAFALTYNVGDTHVFLLPGHFLIALAIAAALGSWRSARLRYAVASRRAGLRRHGGDGIRGLRSIATPIAAPTRNSRISPRASNARSALLVSEMDWQLENVLLYSSRYESATSPGCGSTMCCSTSRFSCGTTSPRRATSC